MAAAEVEMERCKAAIVQMLVRRNTFDLDDDSIRWCQHNCTGKIPLSRVCCLINIAVIIARSQIS